MSVNRNTMTETWALIPIKRLDTAKTRLSPALTRHQRQDLTLAMARDVLSCLVDCEQLAGIAIVSADEKAKQLCHAFEALWIEEPPGADLNTAITAAAGELMERSVQHLICLPADIPLIRPHDIQALLSHHHTAPAVTLAPATNSSGTNALVCSPPAVIPFCYGPDSFYRHQRNASRVGIKPQQITLPNIGLDLDTVQDIEQLLASPSAQGTHTLQVLLDIQYTPACRTGLLKDKTERL